MVRPVRNFPTGWSYRTRWDSNVRGRSWKYMTNADREFRRRVALARIRAMKVVRNLRYRRRVAAAKSQLRYRVSQLPLPLRRKILSYVR